MPIDPGGADNVNSFYYILMDSLYSVITSLKKGGLLWRGELNSIKYFTVIHFRVGEDCDDVLFTWHFNWSLLSRLVQHTRFNSVSLFFCVAGPHSTRILIGNLILLYFHAALLCVLCQSERGCLRIDLLFSVLFTPFLPDHQSNKLKINLNIFIVLSPYKLSPILQAFASCLPSPFGIKTTNQVL